MTNKSRLTLDAFRVENRFYRLDSCMLDSFMRASLSEEDRQVVLAAIADLTIQGTAIARVLRERGFGGSHQVIQRHRTRGCRLCGLHQGQK